MSDAANQAEPVLIKAPCEECSHYCDCPRMRGENVCHGRKEVLYQDRATERPDERMKE